MLCKVGVAITQDTYSYTTSNEVEAPADAYHRYPDNWTKYMEIIAPYKSNYTINVTGTNTHAGSDTSGCRVVTLVNGIEVNNTEYRQTTSSIAHQYIAKNIKAWDKITVTLYSWFNNNSYYNKIKATSGSIECPIALLKTGDTLHPRENKDIWALSGATLYGLHTDKNYYGGIMLEKSTEANTGDITLGNAVGFITVNFNGEIIKIPYYWD